MCRPRREQHAALSKQGWDTDRPDAVEIDSSPSLSTNSCGGPDGLDPKYVRWTRPAERGRRVALRLHFLTAVANMYNVWIEEGRVPDAVAQCRTILLRKVDKEGNKLPANNPSSYRGITMSGVFAKGLSIELAHRLCHWALATGKISPEQVGFMPMKGAEDHVLTLLDTVRHYWSRPRKSVKLCAVFIDFKKAYDRVRPAAMWTVLRRMGIPGRLVDFLATWSGQRVTTLAINGVDSAPIPMSMGLAQGDPLSPLLFNFYLESLIRAVKADPAIHGVSVDAPAAGGRPARAFRYKLLVYADDIVLLCEHPSQAQLAVNAVQRWAQAWGMELGIGGGKTEAMLFQKPGRKPVAAEPLADLTVPGRPERIGWTQEYRYLGYALRPDLDTTGLLDRMLDSVRTAWNRYFYGNGLVKRMSPALALQVYRACVLGTTNYLLAIIQPTQKLLDHIDKHTSKITLEVLGGYSRTPSLTRWAEGRLPTALTLMTRERARLYLKIQHTPFTDSILYNVMGIVKQAADSGRRQSGAAESWVHKTQCLFAGYERTHGVRLLPVPPHGAAARPPPVWDCSRLAAVYGRAVGVLQWQARARRELEKDLGSVPQPAGFSVGSEETKRDAGAFFCLGYNVTAAQLGACKSTTPLSARGPSCAGALLTSVSVPLTKQAKAVLMGVRTGAEGWRRVGTGRFDPAAHEARVADPACRLCQSGKAEGPFHACCECPHPAMVALRAKLARSMPGFVSHAVRLAYDAVRPKDGTDAEALAMAATAYTLAATQDWTSPEGRFIMFRLLGVAPWPAAVAGCPFGALGSFLGTMFDRVTAKPHRLRPLANNWCGWSSKWLQRLHGAYYANWPADT